MSGIAETVSKQRDFFLSGKTQNYDFRMDSLKRLREGILKYEDSLYDALYKDLHKSKFESFSVEVKMSLDDINYNMKNLKTWMKNKPVFPDAINFYSTSEIRPCPLGVVLIMAPWNYPFQLIMSPFIGALTAGNCVVLKPANYSTNTSKLLFDLIHECFDERHVSIFTGNRDVNRALLEERYDHIFFTGSPDLGKKVMEAASRHLTPVTLELGGKSPCIVDIDANLDIAARRIVFGKFINAGQTCVAPDYGFVHKAIADKFLSRMKHHIEKAYTKDPIKSDSFARIINEQQFARLLGLMRHGNIYMGGRTDKETLFIEPTIITGVTESDPIMQEEIFGPLFPVMEFDSINTVIDYLNRHERPLAFYYFSEDKARQDYVLENTISGGASVNDTLMHLSNPKLPFGGVGTSGMGQYHGKHTFETFTHYRSVLRKSTKIDLPLRYAPYGKKFDLLKKIL